MAPASCPKFVDGLRFDRSSRTCSPDDGKLRAIDDVLGACNLKGEKRPLIASSFLVVKNSSRQYLGGNTSGVRMPERSCFYRIYSHVSRLFLFHLFFSSNYAIYLTIALSSYLLESTNAFFLLFLAITALFYLSLFSLFVREEAYCQFRERTVNREINLIDEER